MKARAIYLYVQGEQINNKGEWVPYMHSIGGISFDQPDGAKSAIRLYLKAQQHIDEIKGRADRRGLRVTATITLPYIEARSEGHLERLIGAEWTAF